jgi:thioredoxin 1
MATIELTPANFAETVSSTDALVIDFWAPWCQPCLRFAPVFEAVSEAHPNVVFAKVNTEDHQDIAQALQISAIPTLMALRQGILVFRQPGALNKAQLTDVVTQLEGLDVEELKREATANPTA